MIESIETLLLPIRALHEHIRDAVVSACETSQSEQLASVAQETSSDTIYQIDVISETLLIDFFSREIAIHTPIILVGEGLPNGKLTLPVGTAEEDAVWRIIVDPIDGTAWREFNVPRSSFYRGKQTDEHEGRAGLSRKKTVAHPHPLKTAPEVVEKILELRSAYQIGALRLVFYLERDHGIKISESSVTRVLRAPGVGSLPKTAQDGRFTANALPKQFPDTTFRSMSSSCN